MTRLANVPSLLALLALGCTTTGFECGPGTQSEGEVCLPVETVPPTDEADSPPVITSVTLDELVVEHEESPHYVHYLAPVSAVISVKGEKAHTGVHVTLERPDGSEGCVIGSFEIEHEPRLSEDREPLVDEAVQYNLHDVFEIPGRCDALAGATDLVTRVAFDLLNTTVYPPRAPIPENVDFSLWEASRLSLIDDTTCTAPNSSHPETCTTMVSLEVSPGLDTRMMNLELVSTVVVVPYAHDPLGEADESLITDGPDIVASIDFDSLGASHETEHPEDSLVMTATLRPLPGGQGTGRLSATVDKLPLELQHGDGDFSPSGTLDAGGHHRPVHQQIHLLLQGAAYDEVRGGAWQDVVEFLVDVCVTPVGPQADFGGDELINDCIEVPVVLVRHIVTPNPPGSLVGVADAGVINSPSTSEIAAGVTETFGKHWILSAGHRSSAHWSSGAGWTMGTTEGTTAFDLLSDRAHMRAVQGGFGGAGAWAEAHFFHVPITFFEVGLYYIDYTDQTDRFHLRNTLFLHNYIPRIPGGWPVDDGVLSVRNLLEVASTANGQDYQSEHTTEWPIPNYSVKFEVPCGHVSAGAFVTLTAGLDSTGTNLTKSTLAPDPVGTPSCAGTLRTWDDPVCLRSFDVSANETWLDARKFCATVGGFMPPAEGYNSDNGLVAHDILAELDEGQCTFVNHSWQGAPSGRYSTSWFSVTLSASNFTAGRWGPNGLESGDGVSPFEFNNVGYDGDDSADGLWAVDHPRFGDHRATLCKEGGNAVLRGHSDRGVIGSADAHVCAVQPGRNLGGTDLLLTVRPRVNAGLRAQADVSFETSFGGFDFGMTTDLTVIELALPAQMELSYTFREGGRIGGNWGYGVDLELRTLSGNVTGRVKYRGWFFRTSTHSKTFAEWNGVRLGNIVLVPRTQNFFHVEP